MNILHTHSHPILRAQDLTVARGGRRVIERLSVAIAPGDRLAIVGDNGTGKTTLLLALAGALPADDGAIERAGTLGVVDQVLPVDDGQTVGTLVEDALASACDALAELDRAASLLGSGDATADDAYAAALDRVTALDAWDAERQLDVALEALDACRDLSRPLATLSVGQRHRVRLACVLGGAYDTVMLDEPTNHLDDDALRFLAASLRSRRGGVAVVTHDRALLADVATAFLDLDPSEDGTHPIFRGAYDTWRDEKARATTAWRQRWSAQERERAQLEGAVDEARDRLVSGWRPPKGTGKHQRQTRAASIVRQVHRREDALSAVAVDVPVPPPSLAVEPWDVHDGVVAAAASEVAVEARLTVPVSVTLDVGERLVVAGPNGAGKSTLLAVLAGVLAPTAGAVVHGEGIRVGYLPQEVGEWPEDVVVADLIDEGATSGLIEPRALGERPSHLSQGQQRRLQLALVLAAQPDLLILDEPTNHLSMAIVDQLVGVLQETRAAVVVATHDRQLARELGEWPRLSPGAV